MKTTRNSQHFLLHPGFLLMVVMVTLTASTARQTIPTEAVATLPDASARTIPTETTPLGAAPSPDPEPCARGTPGTTGPVFLMKC